VATWEAGGCYDEIKRRLGYRFELGSVSYPPAAEVGQLVAIELRLRNEGWARITNPRSAYLVLRDGATPRLVGGELAGYSSLAPSQNEAQLVREWAPGADVTLRFSFGAPAAGTYQLSLLLPDPTRPDILDYAVKLTTLRSGAPLYDPSSGENDLGLTMQVE
jgi:hypothetical protein